ncbi:Superfamily II DNA or RNA helicase, SNF2 family [Virgibacillus subterraneus]|uniref:Superfamily II DNA or RNA helicase, SNF2 family n=1 Tax=Virgibacillus subterraneus TaxID=621109 RepID=A0A1H8ZYQ6_9BACI|nr:DEAD/DEAH box helicase [Virgibacillus subterraneus]SEP69387.1 Superfamily II DNA or RNA helicase, SNF2 family [Virgibacillus subterraneus]
MKSFRDINIQKMFPSVVYRRGLEYYNKNLVSDLLYDINYQVWTAIVQGTEDYFVEINTSDFAKGSVDAYCDCPAFDTYGSCKHIVATLISISARETNNPPRKMSDNYQTTNWLIDSISSLTNYQPTSEVLSEKIPLHVEYYFKWSFERNLLLELKVGEKRCLVVKNAHDFLNDVMKGNEHYFTKTFTYSPETHYFMQQDMEIFELLFSVLRNEKIYLDRGIYHYQDSPERSVVIPPLLAKQLLHMLIKRDFTVETRDQSFQHIDIVEDELPFHFDLAKNEQGELVLSMDEMASMTYFKLYQMLFSHGAFYFPAKEQIPIIEQITQVGRENEHLPIPKKQADAFISEVLPSLKKVGDVQIDENVAAEIIQVPLRAKLFLEVQANWIVGKLEYHYGDYQIDPFSGREQDDVIIIRDVEKEQQIMHLIEHANFHYNGKELYIEADEESLYEFLYDVLPLLDKYVELFLTSEIRNFIVENEPSPSTSVRHESSSNLLEIGFNIDGVDDSEISHILNAVMEKKRYYRMQSGALLSLEGDEFSSMKQLFDDLDIQKDDLQDGNVQMPVYRGAQVDELIDTKKNYDPSFRKLLHQLKSPEEQVYPLPESLNATLRDYQMTGYQWFKSLSAYYLGGILADDMGLGKTLQSIAYILSEPSDMPHLIVAPSSVVYNWKNECDKFAPDLNVAILTGAPLERVKKIEEYTDMDVWITSYATLRQDIELYREQSFQTLILDESQYIKNYATKTSRAIREIKASRRFALSGTPIENSIDELWAIFQVILPGLMPNQRSFKQLSHEKIAQLTKPFILRRLKKDVLKELPDKIETVHVSELTKDQKDLYVGYWRELQQEAAQSMKESGFNQNRMKILAGLTRLRQICCHPSVFVENYQGESGKLNQLMDTVRNAIANGKRMLIFSQFTSMHEIIIEKLKQEEIDYFYLHGQTASEDRVKMSERFNNGENNVFLISLKAGGTGLNLTGADTVILYDLWWNPAVEDQATGRAHRFGQKNVVQVIRLITEGTIEEKIYDLQQKKRELIDQVIQPGETMLSSLSEDDVRELLNI